MGGAGGIEERFFTTIRMTNAGCGKAERDGEIDVGLALSTVCSLRKQRMRHPKGQKRWGESGGG